MGCKNIGILKGNFSPLSGLTMRLSGECKVKWIDSMYNLFVKIKPHNIERECANILWKKLFFRRKHKHSFPVPQIMQPRFPHVGKSQSIAHLECNGRNFQVKINNTNKREWRKNDQADTFTVSVSSTSASLLGNNNDNIFCIEDDQTSEVINTIIKTDFSLPEHTTGPEVDANVHVKQVEKLGSICYPFNSKRPSSNSIISF